MGCGIRKIGKTTYLDPCPICGSKSTNNDAGHFVVYPETNSWSSFSTKCTEKKGGSIIDLMIEVEGLSKAQAIEKGKKILGIEPVSAVFTMGIGEPLLLLALRALAVHLVIVDVVGEEQAAGGTLLGVPLADFRPALLMGAEEDRAAGAAPVLSLFPLLAYRTFFHDTPHRD